MSTYAPIRNLQGIRCIDIAQELIESCMTPHQQALLRYQQGNVTIEPWDELNAHYAERFLTYTLDYTKKLFAIRLQQYGYLLEEIARFQDILTILLDKAAYYKSRKSNSTMDNVNISTTHSTDHADTNTGSQTVGVEDALDIDVMSSFKRGAATATNRLIPNLEERDSKKQLEPLPLREKKRVIVDFKNYTVQTNNVPNTPGADIRNVDPAPEQPCHDPNVIPYNDLTYDFGKSQHELNRIVQTEGGTVEKVLTNSTSVGSGGSMSHNEGTVIYSEFRDADAQIKALGLKIPNLRVAFFNKFLDLFANIPPHLIRHV